MKTNLACVAAAGRRQGELFHTIAGDLANSRRWPQWRPDSEFHAIRERFGQQR